MTNTMCYRLILSLLTGIIATLFLAQYDPWTQTQLCAYLIRTIQESYGCKLAFDSAQISLIPLRVTVNKLQATPNEPDDQSWQWHCNRYITRGSWLQLLQKGTLELNIELHDLQINSNINGKQLAILPHLQKLCTPNHQPITTTSIRITNALLQATDLHYDRCYNAHWNSETKRMRNGYRSNIQIADATCTQHDTQLISKGNGALQAHVDTAGELTAQINGAIFLSFLKDKPNCFVSGSWNKSTGHFTLHDLTKTLCLDPVILTTKHDGLGFRISGHLPATHLLHLINKSQPPPLPIDGTVSLSAHGTIGTQNRTRGNLLWSSSNNSNRDNAKLSFALHNGSWSGQCVLHGPSNTEFDGTWNWSNTSGNGTMILSNTIDLRNALIPYWHIRPRDALAKITYTHASGLNIQHTCHVANEVTTTQLDARGSVTAVNGITHVSGNAGLYRYQGTADIKKLPLFLTSAQVTDEQGGTIIQISRDEESRSLELRLPIHALRTSLASLVNSDLQGEGTVLITLGISPHNNLNARINLSHGVIRLPQTHNFIDGFDAHCTIDTERHQLLLENLACSLHSGFVSAAHGRIAFSQQWLPTAAYLPLTFDRCLLNVKQDLFASLSGALTYTLKPSTQPIATGFVIVERAQLKENLLWQELQEQVLKPSSVSTRSPLLNPLLDIKVATKEPIRVDTGFLETNARASLQLSHTAHDPHVQGTLSLSGGSLAFTYKPLLISGGTVNFNPPHLGNATVELVAKNRVKKYEVQLHVNGTFQDQQVSLESSPPLSEEQIVALLLVGSDEEALNIMAPLLLAQNARDLLFGSHKSPSLAGGPGARPRPFRVAFVPSFTDQTARGGLRGGIEITAYDRWRALIQKNFSLTEDTRFELEYAVTDDVTARCTRDERRDIAGEVEMRWKF